MTQDVARLFDAMADDADDLEPWYVHLYARLHALVRVSLRPRSGGSRRALDAGCGTGLQTAILADLGWDVHGLDLAARPLAMARRRVPGARLVQGRLETLPYRDAAFEAVACCGSTLSFVETPARALAELARVLAPGGRLLLECEQKWSADLAWTAASALMGDPLGYGVRPGALLRALAGPPAACWLPYPGYGRLRLFARGELRALLAAAGLVEVEARGIHAATGLIPSTVLHRPALSRPLAALYRGLCALDTRLGARTPALASSLVVLARRCDGGTPPR